MILDEEPQIPTTFELSIIILVLILGASIIFGVVLFFLTLLYHFVSTILA